MVKYANVREDIVDKVGLNPWKTHNQTNLTEVQTFIDVLYENGAIQNKENINDYSPKK